MMARARNIKPGFFANEDLVELPFHTRLLFIGLWTLCDRSGRMEDRPKRIKMALFPADDLNIEDSLRELELSGFLLRYEHGADRYIQVLAFDKHQNPHKDEKASTIPAPCSHNASTVQSTIEADTDTVAIGLIPDPLFSDSLSPDPSTAVAEAPSAPLDQVTAVFEFWKQIMKSPRSLLDDKRKKAIKAALKTGYTVEQLCDAINGCAKSDFHMGKNDRGEKYNGLDLILRNAEKIDKFIAIGRSPLVPVRTAPKTYHDISGMDYTKGVDADGNF